ncbi:hypothetical protein FA15DRAFT_670638 [Coprinopsis marcescibilis]|uniref:RRN7-type domain-containing protein n=1 Tax=Coprinopsis marcescibilis TaxID=230819 RepID=A0A5C3KRK4_COPMA|nr:hypothetical protein FA15DRAFT_670638 [Coprinopsis marcescibilis]
MAPRKRCPTCGSRQWHKEPSSGLIACSEGHVLQNYRKETIEVQDVGPHALKKRTLKSGARKKALKSKANPNLYHGARGRYHYFLCLQLIFRKQVAVLINLWRLPAEFENLCRDIWALYLECMPNPIPPEPFNFAQQEDGSAPGNRHAKLAETPVSPEPPAQYAGGSGPPVITLNLRDADESTASSGSDSDSDNEEELDRLMKENSDRESSEEDDEVETRDDDLATSNKQKRRKPSSRRYQDTFEGPANTIAILALACWTFRIPVLYRDFSRIIESYELPYLDPCRLLPQSMVKHLTKHNQQALSPQHAPRALQVHQLASRLADKLHSVYATSIPEINAAPVLWRVVRAMGGSPTIYALTKRVASTLSLPLTLRHNLATTSNLAQNSAHEPSGHHYDSIPPEASLMACCVIVLKLVYGLDGVKRWPRDGTDPACALPRYEAFIGLLRSMEKDEAKQLESVFSAQSAMDIANLSEPIMDDYLTFCETALLGREPMPHDVLDRYFPLRTDHVPAENDPVVEFRAALPAMRLQEGASVQGSVKTGEKYKIWSARDRLGALPEDYEYVLERAAGWLGVPEEFLEGVVDKYERRLWRWHEKSIRKPRRRRREATQEEEWDCSDEEG